MSAWTCRGLSARSPERSFHLVFESHDGRAYVPIPERSTSLRATSTLPVVDSLNALDPNRPIREADIDAARWNISETALPRTSGGCDQPLRRWPELKRLLSASLLPINPCARGAAWVLALSANSGTPTPTW